MKRFKIIIPQEKRYLLSLLYDKFPCFSLDMSNREKPVTFVASLEEGKDYSSDLAWLKRIGLLYLDERMEREKVISAFFNGLLLEGMAVTNVRFQEGDMAHPDYNRVILTLGDATNITLHVPHDWMPPERV